MNCRLSVTWKDLAKSVTWAPRWCTCWQYIEYTEAFGAALDTCTLLNRCGTFKTLAETQWVITSHAAEGKRVGIINNIYNWTQLSKWNIHLQMMCNGPCWHVKSVSNSSPVTAVPCYCTVIINKQTTKHKQSTNLFSGLKAETDVMKRWVSIMKCSVRSLETALPCQLSQAVKLPPYSWFV